MLKFTPLYIAFFLLPFGKNILAQATLDNYIKEGISSSLTLKQEGFLLEKAVFALEEAKRLHQPNVNFSATYTLGAGGRNINFPIGDLLNPAYSTLNTLTKSNNFPQLKNLKFNLNPYNFYDAKFRTTYPLINAEIKINERVKAQAIPLKQAEINVYKRELVKEIKTAYFRYLQATQGIQIFENAIKLLNELKRVNQSLVNNGVSNTSVLVRSNAEIAKIDAQLTEAKNNQKNAAAYFNFLLNKELSADIQVDTLYLSHNNVFPKDIKADTKSREELMKLQTAATLVGLGLTFQKSYFKPKLGVFIDAGIQGFVAPTPQTPYVFGGLSFEYPIYDGKRSKQREQQAQMDINALQVQTDNVENQLELQLVVAVNSYYSALSIYQNAQGQIQLTERYYSDLFKRYKEGQALLIELTEAHTQQLNAALQRSIALSNVWIKLTDIERISAGYEFK
jgi:outer membrane protein TolC